MSRVGFIGLGAMGTPMARHLLAAGHELTIYARREESARPLLETGARHAPTPAAVLHASDVVITIVTADDDVRGVALGPDGLIEAAAPGKLFIDMSTIAPATIRSIAAKLTPAGLATLDAPVSGGPWGAAAGNLTIMAGGKREDFDRALPLFEALGDPQRIFHLGPLGAGQTVKLANQLLGGAMMTLIGEAFALGRAADIDLHRMVDVIAVSSGNSAMLEARGKKFVLSDFFQPGFKTSLMHKDVGLALDLGRQLRVPLPVTAAAHQLYTAAVRDGLGEQDFAAVTKLYRPGADPSSTLDADTTRRGDE